MIHGFVCVYVRLCLFVDPRIVERNDVSHILWQPKTVVNIY